MNETYYSCPPLDLTDSVKEVICILKRDGYDESYFIDKYYLYNSTQISETYHGCPDIEYSEADAIQTCKYAAYGWTPDDEGFGWVYDTFIDKYGIDAVNAKVDECNEAAGKRKDTSMHKISIDLYKRGQLLHDHDLAYSEGDATLTCKFATYGWTPDDEDFGWVYQTLIGKYGIDAVNAKVYECNVAAGKRKDTSMHKVLIDLYERGHPSRHHLKQILKKRIQTLEEDQIDHLKKKVRER